MRIVIGDIHGCFDELMMLLEKIGPSKDDEIISIGDMVDRGFRSPQVVSFFMNGEKTTAIRGNHERKHILHVEGELPEKYFGIFQQETRLQFERSFSETRLTYLDAVAYFNTLPLYLEFPEAIVVHAALNYGTPMRLQNEKVLTGAGFPLECRKVASGLFSWCERYPKHAKPVIFGHLGIGRAPWPLPQRENLWPIDTGCAAGGYLTAVMLPDFKVFRVKALRDYTAS